MKQISNPLPDPSWIVLETESNTYSCPFENDIGFEDQISVHIERKRSCTGTGQEALSIQLKADDIPVKSIRLRFPVTFPSKTQFLADAWERGYGVFQWRGLSANRYMPWYFLAASQQNTTGIGVRVRPGAMCFWQVDSSGLTLYMDTRCGGDGVVLDGRTLFAADIVSSRYETISSYEAAQAFCKEMCSDPIFPKKPVYGSNNWYYAYGDSSEEEILKDTDYLMTLAKEAFNPPFMVIDDGWQQNHRLKEYNGGPWKYGNEKFPDMKKLADEIRVKGALPGIWIRFLLNEDVDIPKQWRLPLNGCLDPSHPDVLAYIAEDVTRICEWGYQLIKHDFSTFDLFSLWGFEMKPLVTPDGWHFFDRSKTSAEIVIQLYQTVLDAAKPYDAIILGCNTIGHLGAGLMHMNRTGDDTSGLNWERTRQIGINTLAFRLPQHGAFYDVDADCVGIAGNIPWKYNRQWTEVLARSGTSVFLSVKPGILNESETREMQSYLLLASTQEEHCFPADWEDTDCPEIWVSPATRNQIHYHWYEPEGTHFSRESTRYETYLSIV